MRRRHPDAFIIWSGHGTMDVKPCAKAFCDKIIWSLPIPSEIGWGHPYCVQKGLEYAKEVGATRVLKMRADSVSLREDIFEYCDEIIEKEKTKCLVTAQTNLTNLIGDLFMYGDVDFLLEIWKRNKWSYDKNAGMIDGMSNLWRIYHSNSKYNNLRECFSYRNCKDLQWILIDTDEAYNFSKWEEHLWDKKYWSYITEQQFYA